MRHFLAYLCGLIFLLAAPMVVAQPSPDALPDYAAWNDLAKVAIRATEEETASNDRFEVLRESVAEFRARFNAARSLNAPRMATLREQIAALGEKPADGVEEPREIAEKRAELTTQLQALLVPVQEAEQAFLQADGLVGEIDAIIRERQTRRLLSLGQSPLNPAHWPKALSDVKLIASDLWEETSAISDPDRQRQFRENLPLVLLMLAIALTFIARGRSWAGRALSYLRRWGGRGSGVWRFLVSLFRIILPLVGLLILTSAIRASGVVGLRIEQVLEAIPYWGGLLLGFRWLGERLFPRDAEDALILLSDENRRNARYYLLVLSIALVLTDILDLLVDLDDVGPATLAVLAFPVVVVMGLALVCIGMLLRKYRVEAVENSTDPQRGTSLARVLRFAGNAMVLVGVIAPAMTAIGYFEAGNALLHPTAGSAAILGLTLALQRFFADVYCLATGQGSEGRDALIPALTGFVLVLLSLPFLALNWGARVADLTELWDIFNRGFALGETRISPSDFLTFAIIFGAGYGATRMLQSTLRVNVLPKTRIDIGGQNALISGVGYVGIFLAALLAITGAGIDLSSLAIVAGALSVGIGFGLRTIVENFVSGIILLVGRPISEGDWIEVGGRMGYVRNISVRSTRIETFDKTDVIVPNADLVAGTVTNYTRGNTIGRLIISIGVAYGTETRRVSEILLEIAKRQPMVLANPEPSVVFNNFGADALEFDLRMFLRDVNWMMVVKDEVNHQIAERFAEEGIEIPFAQRDVWLRNPEVLRPEAPTPEGQKPEAPTPEVPTPEVQKEDKK